MLSFGQVHMRNSEQERMWTIAQVSAVELVPQLAEEEHMVLSVALVVQMEEQLVEVASEQPEPQVMAEHHTRSMPVKRQKLA